MLRAASAFIRETAKRRSPNGRAGDAQGGQHHFHCRHRRHPGQAGYSSGKAGIIGLTKTLAKEWGRYNVNVNAVGFGLIGTRLVQPLTDATAHMEMHGHQIRLGFNPVFWIR